MGKEELTPSESEWRIMEIVWERKGAVTSAEIIAALGDKGGMSGKMTRVLINRLCQKGILTYTVDPHDARVYRYRAAKTRKQCLKEKSRNFVDSYFDGSETTAVAALLQNAVLTDEQIGELEALLEKSRGKS